MTRKAKVTLGAAAALVLFGSGYGAGYAVTKSHYEPRVQANRLDTPAMGDVSGDLQKANQLLAEKKYDEAIALLSKLASDAKDKNDKLSALLLLGSAYQFKGDLAKAVEVYQQANKVDGERLEALMGIGNASSAYFFQEQNADGDRAKKAQPYLKLAIDSYKKSLELAQDPALKEQINQQLQVLEQVKSQVEKEA